MLIEGQLSKSDLPDSLMTFVEQIEMWRKFFKPLNPEIFDSSRYSTITPDGFYTIPVQPYAFKTGVKKDEIFDPEEEMDKWLELEHGVFDFNPQAQPPKIGNDYVWWELPDKKIIIVLSHQLTYDRVIDHYGYRETYDSFLQERRRKNEREMEALKETGRRHTREEVESCEFIRKHLFGE